MSSFQSRASFPRVHGAFATSPNGSPLGTKDAVLLPVKLEWRLVALRTLRVLLDVAVGCVSNSLGDPPQQGQIRTASR